MSPAGKTPLPAGEREGPAAKRWEGEGKSPLARALTQALRACPTPLEGEG